MGKLAKINLHINIVTKIVTLFKVELYSLTEQIHFFGKF